MSKRGADKQLTHENWDKEDSEPETAGEFQAASQEVLKNRVIKKARRRINRDDSGSGTAATASPFAAFSGFGAPKSTSGGTGNLFGFLSTPTAGGSSKSPDAATSSMSPPPTARPSIHRSGSSTPVTASAPPSSSTSEITEYQRQLRSLNHCLLSWVRQHVESNPYCILSPVFTDYNKHLEDMNSRYGSGRTTLNGHGVQSSPALSIPAAKSSVPQSPGTSASSSSTVSTSTTTTTTAATSGGGFRFGSSVPSVPAATVVATSGFSFGFTQAKSTTTSAPSTAGFSFGFQAGGQGSGGGQKSAEEPAAGEEEETDTPPVPEVTQVREDDALYSKRCKLFYKKEGQFVEKGVGTLHLKPCGEKTQLLIRADTNLGNILLNIKLNSSIPTQRMGKNNVMLACVPNPPLDPKSAAPAGPVPLLIRVKTGDDADELLAKLDQLKK